MLQISRGTISTWRHGKTIDYELIIDFCEKRKSIYTGFSSMKDHQNARLWKGKEVRERVSRALQ